MAAGYPPDISVSADRPLMIRPGRLVMSGLYDVG